jgi:hypothetical protein
LPIGPRRPGAWSSRWSRSEHCRHRATSSRRWMKLLDPSSWPHSLHRVARLVQNTRIFGELLVDRGVGCVAIS